jgi:hypothetical protein
MYICSCSGPCTLDSSTTLPRTIVVFEIYMGPFHPSNLFTLKTATVTYHETLEEKNLNTQDD